MPAYCGHAVGGCGVCDTPELSGVAPLAELAAWPLQDIVLLLVIRARNNPPFILPARLRLHCPQGKFSYTVAILLHGYWAILEPPHPTTDESLCVGLLPVWLRWDVASLVLVWRFEDLID